MRRDGIMGSLVTYLLTTVRASARRARAYITQVTNGL